MRHARAARQGRVPRQARHVGRGIGQRGAHPFEPGAVISCAFGCARMKPACRHRPVAALRMEILEETGGIGGIAERVEHFGRRAECHAMPAVIDLETPDIEAARAARHGAGDKGLCLGAGFEPMPLALHVDGPWPGLETAPASGLDAGDRAHHRQRHPHAMCHLPCCGIAQGGARHDPRHGQEGNRQDNRETQGYEHVLQGNIHPGKHPGDGRSV